MLSAIIVEDEIPAAERLKVLLKDSSVLPLEHFTRAKLALEWFKTHQADIVFVDIGLPEMTGIEFVSQLQHFACSMPRVIFTTAYEEYALKAFELAATDYLLKPIKINRLLEALQRIPNYQQETGGQEFVEFCVTKNHRMQKIAWQRAAYLLADQKMVWLYTFDGQVYALPETLIHWEEVLGSRVIRIYRNILVFRHAIQSVVRMKQKNPENKNPDEPVEQYGVQLIDLDIVLPVSRRQLRVLKKEFDS